MVWELDVCLLSIGPFFVNGIDALRMKGINYGGVSLVGSSGRKKGGGTLKRLGRALELVFGRI